MTVLLFTLYDTVPVGNYPDLVRSLVSTSHLQQAGPDDNGFRPQPAWLRPRPGVRAWVVPPMDIVIDFLRQTNNRWALYHQQSGKMLAYHHDKTVLLAMQPTWQSLGIPTLVRHMTHNHIGGNLEAMRKANRLRQQAYRDKHKV